MEKSERGMKRGNPEPPPDIGHLRKSAYKALTGPQVELVPVRSLAGVFGIGRRQVETVCKEGYFSYDHSNSGLNNILSSLMKYYSEYFIEVHSQNYSFVKVILPVFIRRS